MKHRINLQLRRYLSADEFLGQLKQLHAYRGPHPTSDLLQWFERSGQVRPVVRLVWPDPIARRWWRDNHEWAGDMRDPVEPDGDRLEAAQALDQALSRAAFRSLRDDGTHPFDDPEPTWSPFLQSETQQSALAPADRRFSVANARDPVLFDRHHIQDFYSAWQILAAAEIADMGLFFRLDMTNEKIVRDTREGLREGRAPDGPSFELSAPTRAMHQLREHRAALDAEIWASEEANIAFARATRGMGSGRIQLGEAATQKYQADRVVAAKTAMDRFGVSVDDGLALCQFLAEQWQEWDHEGRPLIAEAYRIHLAATVRMLQLAHDLSFEDIAERVGPQGDRTNLLLRYVWPDWAAEQRDRVIRTLRPSLAVVGPGAVSDAELAEFARFLEEQGQDAFFLRLQSFEDNAFDPDAPSPMIGMASDLQGIAVAVEHVVRAMGGTGGQLYTMFKKLWAGTAVETHLKSNDQLARNAGLMDDWPALKKQIARLATKDVAGAVAGQLIMAHRVRGAVHKPMPDDDQLELEQVFVQIMAAAAMTHAHLERQAASTMFPVSPPTPEV